MQWMISSRSWAPNANDMTDSFFHHNFLARFAEQAAAHVQQQQIEQQRQQIEQLLHDNSAYNDYGGTQDLADAEQADELAELDENEAAMADAEDDGSVFYGGTQDEANAELDDELAELEENEAAMSSFSEDLGVDIQCHRCGKYRTSTGIPREHVRSPWCCEMNLNTQFNRCDIGNDDGVVDVRI